MSSNKLRKFHSDILLASLRSVQWAISRLPRPFIDVVVRGLFAIAYIFLTRLRQICIKNLKAVYKDTETENRYQFMTRKCIKNIGYSMVDMLYYVDRPKDLLAVTTVNNEHRLQDTLKLGHGAIMITAHLGNFPLMFEALVQKGYKVNVIIRPMRDPEFGKFMHAECKKWNINMIELSPPKEFLRNSVGALRRNELLFIMLDEVVEEGQGVKVNFFDHMVERAAGPSLFHERVGSPILPAFIVKKDDGKFEITIEDVLKIDENLPDELREAKCVSELTKIIEGYVRRYPLQWGGWLNKRWN